MALYVVVSVSFWQPQVEPESAFRTLLRERSRERTFSEWAWKRIVLSKVTPSIFGLFTVGIRLPRIEIGSVDFTSAFQVVKSVAVDFSADSCKLRF